MYNSYSPFTSAGTSNQFTNQVLFNSIVPHLNCPLGGNQRSFGLRAPVFACPTSWANQSSVFDTFTHAYKPLNYRFVSQPQPPSLLVLNSSTTSVSSTTVKPNFSISGQVISDTSMLKSFKQPSSQNSSSSSKIKKLSKRAEKVHALRKFQEIPPKVRSEVHIVEKKKSPQIKSEVHRVKQKAINKSILKNQASTIVLNEGKTKKKRKRIKKKRDSAQTSFSSNISDSTQNKTNQLKSVVQKVVEKSRMASENLIAVPLTRTITNDVTTKSNKRSLSPLAVIIIDDDDEEYSITPKISLSSAQTSKEKSASTRTLSTEEAELGINVWNWRCRAMFNGKFATNEIPANCQRPQSSTGRTFPASKKYYKPEKIYDNPMQSMSPQMPFESSNVPSTSKFQVCQTSTVATTTKTTITTQRKRFTNKSLRIIGGKRIYNQSDECYQFVQNQKCQSGIFCVYAHDGSKAHNEQKTCMRFLQGKCRAVKKCSHGAHSLLQKHQIPVCEFYLRMLCSHQDCQYLHVKHSDDLPPCPNFNKGICHKGIYCTQTHRYYYSLVKSRGQYSENDANTDVESTDAADSSNGLLKWYT